MRRLLAGLALLSVPILTAAADLEIVVRDGSGRPVDEAVVWAIPETGSVPPPDTESVMDQRNRMFVPHVLPVQTGTPVRFPNSDNVRHQVYSFSPAKRFQLPLYEGSPAEPIVFDKPGIVSLGCNIHDRMSAFIVVVDTPWFAVTTEGRATLDGLPPGNYMVHTWHSRSRREIPSHRLEVTHEATQKLVITLGAG